MLKVLQIFMWTFVGPGLLMLNMALNLKPRFKKTWINILIPVLSFTIITVLLYFYTDNALINYVGTLFIFLYGILFNQGKLKEKIFITVIIVLIGFFCDLSISFLFMKIRGSLPNPRSISYDSLEIITIYDFILFWVLYIFTYFYRKKKNLILDKSLALMFLIPTGQLITFEAILRKTISSIELSKKIINYNFIILGMIISVVADILMFIVLFENSAAKKNLIKITQLEYNEKLSESYYNNIIKNAEQLMKYKHDINNMLTAAANLIRSEDENNHISGLKMLDELKEKNRSNIIPVYCENPIVNAVLYDKQNYAADNGIDFVFETSVPAELAVSLTDLCSVFSNLIDNAMNGAIENDNKSVELKAWCDMGYLFVKTKNHTDNFKNISSVKEKFDINNIKNHGYGLDILQDISEKYNGKLNIESAGDYVEVVCCLKTDTAPV